MTTQTTTAVPFLQEPGRPLSGWYAVPAEPKAGAPVLLCIHGGSYTAHYWNNTAMGADTVAQLGSAAGMGVIAITRPGFGPEGGPTCSYDEQVDRILDTAANIIAGPLASVGERPGVVVIGHSIGSMLAILTAGRRHPDVDVIGIDISGSAADYLPGAQIQRLRDLALLTDPIPVDPAGRLSRFFGPPETWDPAVGAEDVDHAPDTIPYDIAQCADWPRRLPEAAAAVRVPVNYSIAALDSIWPSDDAAVEDMRALFTNAPSFTGAVQPAAGHCGQLHYTGGDVLRDTVSFAAGLARVAS